MEGRREWGVYDNGMFIYISNLQTIKIKPEDRFYLKDLARSCGRRYVTEGGL